MITRIKEKERISDHANTGTIHPIAQANSPLRPPAHADDHTAVRVGACRRVGFGSGVELLQYCRQVVDTVSGWTDSTAQ